MRLSCADLVFVHAKPHSSSPDILGNTTVVAQGSILDSSVNPRELSYLDFVEAPVTAGFCSFVRTQRNQELASSLFVC